MKKALLILAFAAVAALVVSQVVKRSGALESTPGRAAALAPAGTAVFIEFPDIGRSKSRWKETALRKIADEPEWKEFTAKWDDFKTQNAEMREVVGVFDQIEKADPAGLFFAFSSFDGPSPKVVGGFSYRGRKSDVQAVVASVRKKILDTYPAAKAGDLTSFEGSEIETLTDTDLTLSMAFRDNWFLFATDRDLLLGTLSRYIGKPGAPAALAGDALWKDTIKQGPRDPDMTVFLDYGALMKKLKEEIAATTKPEASFDPNPTKIESMLYSAKMDGLLMREHFYVRAEKPPKLDPFANRMSAFTSPLTYAYAAGQVGIYAEQVMEPLVKMDETSGGPMSKALATKGLKITDLPSIFGPEIGIMSDWNTGALAIPTLFAAVELRDGTKARLIADLLVADMGASEKIAKSEHEGTTFWALQGPVPAIQPTLAVNDKHLIFGLNPDTIKTALTQAAVKEGHLSGRGDYQTGLKTVAEPKIGVLYVDLKTLFERLYEKLKPMAAYSLVGQPEVAKYLDPGKLPKAETISRHLLPMVISWADAENGMQMDCSGSISLFQAYIPAVAGGAFFMFRTMGAPSSPAVPPPTINPAPPVQKP